jgi:hypothetical protein
LWGKTTLLHHFTLGVPTSGKIKSKIVAIKRYFVALLPGRVVWSCSYAKDKPWGYLLASFGLVVSLLCHFRCSIALKKCFLACFFLYQPPPPPPQQKESCWILFFVIKYETKHCFVDPSLPANPMEIDPYLVKVVCMDKLCGKGEDDPLWHV